MLGKKYWKLTVQHWCIFDQTTLDFEKLYQLKFHKSKLLLCEVFLYSYTYLLSWILGVASKQLRLLHGRVGDSTIVVNSLSPQMSELVEDAIAS